MLGVLKLPFGKSWVVVLQRRRLSVRRVDPGHLEGAGCCKEHGVRTLTARFKVLGLMSPDLNRIANLEWV